MLNRNVSIVSLTARQPSVMCECVLAAVSTLTLSVCRTLGRGLDEMTERWMKKVGQEWQSH